MILMVASTGCQKNDVVDGKGEGILKISGKEFLITEARMYVNTSDAWGSFWGRQIEFLNEGQATIACVVLSSSELISQTYSNSEIYGLGISVFIESDYDIPQYDDKAIDLVISPYNAENVVMEVKKSGNTYKITITGKTKEKEHDFTITYKGKIREEGGYL